MAIYCFQSNKNQFFPVCFCHGPSGADMDLGLDLDLVPGMVSWCRCPGKQTLLSFITVFLSRLFLLLLVGWRLAFWSGWPFISMIHHHHHQKAFRNKSHTSHGHRPGLKRNKSEGITVSAPHTPLFLCYTFITGLGSLECCGGCAQHTPLVSYSL